LLKFGSVEPLIGDEYNKLIGLSRISLCFFSSLNEDVYTRRNFEIPAIGGAMLSQYSEEITRFFSPETEARYFKTLDDIPNQVSQLLSSDSEREAMAALATGRLHRDRHTNRDRIATVLEQIDSNS
jgi:spore maturation protein CgeB